MSNVQSYILWRSSDRTKASAFANATAEDLQAQKTSLLEVVQSLGSYISNDDATVRSQAVEYLSDVVGDLPAAFLSRQQTEVICQFLCDRIEDDGALDGLSKVQKFDKFTATMAMMIFRASTATFHDLQVRAQPVRHQVICLLNDLLSGHRSAMRGMGSEFVTGVVDIVSGEKDPRNLMIVFSVLRVVIMEWDISNHAEALFDSVFCYFPITFRPPPNDPYGITAHDLKNRLRDCIAASQLFAPYVFPQLLDKLDSPSSSVKKDVMQTIASCVSSYGLVTVSNYSITLWDALKFEILSAQEADVADDALLALQALGARLARDDDNTHKEKHLERFLKAVLTDCWEQLQEPTHKQAKPAGRILQTLGATSPNSFDLIAKDILPRWMTTYQGADNTPKQKALLEILIQLLESAVTLNNVPNVAKSLNMVDSPLTPFKNDFLQLGTQALMGAAVEELSFRIVGLNLLLTLGLLRQYLETSELSLIVQCLNDILVTQDPNGRDDLKKEAIRAVIQLSSKNHSVIMDKTLPNLMSRLPDNSNEGSQGYLSFLETLAQVSTERHVSETVIRRLLNKLDIVLQNQGGIIYAQAILSTIYYILSHNNVLGHENSLFYHQKINVNLIGRLVLASAGKGPATALNDAHTLQILGRLWAKIVRSLNADDQQSVGRQVYTLFVGGETFSPVPFRSDSKPAEKLTMIISTYVLAAAPSTLPPDFLKPHTSDFRGLLDALIQTALSEDISNVHQAIIQQVGLVANKFLRIEHVPDALQQFERVCAELRNMEAAAENSVRVGFWLAKGLLLRSLEVDRILRKLLQLLAIPHCSLLAARGFGLLLAPDEILSRENGANIRLLAKQKIFSTCTATIAPVFRDSNTSMKPNYLVALCGLSKHVPTEVLMPEIDDLLPMLLQSLELDDMEIKAATIENLRVVCVENPTAIEGHVGSLVKKLLNSVKVAQQNSAKVRCLALHCLRSLPGKVKESSLLPYKTLVTRGLLVALDDSKRGVRYAAVDCRTTWLGMDEPQSE